MGKSHKVDPNLLSYAHEIIETTKNIDQYKRAISITLSSDLGLTTDQIAEYMRVSLRTVFRLRDELTEVFEGNDDPRLHWGGRRNSLLSADDEKKFLAKWEDRARRGELISVKPIHADLTELVGREIPLSSTYNLLSRNGWRKIKPDTRHPKSSLIDQEQFKKNSQNLWLPLPKRITK
ncbi:MAG: winged helix-turn-helix domain-containing protein [Deltaproteobacteria bacterium]|jgi:transposase|nr:winged helix-turn-helix domain-containing protein [Deltaproteobacteria bacterium]